MAPAGATLVGVATGLPDGGVAVIRLSGPRAFELASAAGAEPPSDRRVAYRRVPGVGEGVEEILCLGFRGPASFTGEDVVELHVHGGSLNVELWMDRLMELGATAAGPGDFSRRAFERGRASLDELEGVAALVAAETEAGLDLARRLASGELGRAVQAIDERLFELLARIEASIDFPEDVGEGAPLQWSTEARALRAELRSWVNGFESGERARRIPRVVLAGPPNAGKSSLFNALLGRSRALVSSSAGTTRDYVESELRLSGRRVTLVDTAGDREAQDRVERAGIEAGREQRLGAEVVVWLCEAGQTAEGPVDAIRVRTKVDLGKFEHGPGLRVSAHSGAGLAELKQEISQRLEGGVAPWLGLARHRVCAQEAADALGRVVEIADADGAYELLAFELSIARRRLGAITGRGPAAELGVDVLNEIFSRFCIGK